MQAPEGEVRAQAKQRLFDLLKAAAGGIVVAAATLAVPSVDASSSSASPPAALEQRIKNLREQIADSLGHAPAANEMLAAFNNWGNHWNNWNNWHNWHNWHNH